MKVKDSVMSDSLQSHGIVHGTLQARILEWVAFPFSRDLPKPGIEPRSPALQADSLPAETQGKSLSHAQFYHDHLGCNLLGSSVHGISQARILVWVAISFFMGSSQPRG